VLQRPAVHVINSAIIRGPALCTSSKVQVQAATTGATRSYRGCCRQTQ
jgi:hypothetical protein